MFPVLSERCRATGGKGPFISLYPFYLSPYNGFALYKAMFGGNHYAPALLAEE